MCSHFDVKMGRGIHPPSFAPPRRSPERLPVTRVTLWGDAEFRKSRLSSGDAVGAQLGGEMQ
jgi:hypothetical protein